MCNRNLVTTGRRTRHNKHGITMLALGYMMRNQFYFDKSYIDTLQHYYVHAMKPKQFLTSMREGTVSNEGICYEVIYHNTTAKAIAYWGLTHPDCHVKLSFRAAYSSFNLPNIVLVKLYKQTLLT